MLPTDNRTSRHLIAALVAVAALLRCSWVRPARSSARPCGGVEHRPGHAAEQVRKKKADVAGQIDTLNATSDQVNAALGALDETCEGPRPRPTTQRRRCRAARRRRGAAPADEAQAIDQLKSQVAEAAVEAYVHPPGDAALQVFEQDSANDAVTKSQMLTVANGNNFDVVDQFKAAKQTLEVARDSAAKAQAQAAARASTLAEKVDGLKQARTQQAQVAASVDRA
jgi:hypothetical protein